MNKNLTGHAVDFCNALSVSERISIIRVLGVNEMCECGLIESTGMHPLVLSNHMRVMHQAGIIAERKDEGWMYYSILDREAIEAAASRSCVAAGNVQEDIHVEAPAQNIDSMIGKYRSLSMYEAEALFRRGC